MKNRSRFLSKIKKEGACWIWQAAKANNGTSLYGQYWNGEKVELAHRYSYRKLVGVIPPDMTIDHICRKTLCVNPDHLRVMTLRENILIGDSACARNARKTHCPRGHEYTQENTKRRKNGKQCRICFNESNRRYRERVRKLQKA